MTAPEPDPRRRHRGPDPRDREVFTPARVARLQQAVADLSSILTMGYARPASVALVGDRYGLSARERAALQRLACSDRERAARAEKHVAELRGARLAVDGVNVLTTVERALAGGVVLACRDGAYRDLASHGRSYRRVAETEAALDALATHLAAAGLGGVDVLVDAPMQNSGRVAALWRAALDRAGVAAAVAVVDAVDRRLAASPHVVASADSSVLDACGAWHGLARGVVMARVSGAWVVAAGPVAEG